MASGVVAAGRPRVGVNWIGVSLVTAAAVLSGLSGVLSRVLLDHGLSAPELAQMRLTVCGVVLLAVFRHSVLRLLRDRAVGRAQLVALGVIGMAGLQLCFLAALRRLDVALALLLLYLAPAIVAGWELVVHRRGQRRSVWVCIAIMVLGLAVALGLGPDTVQRVSVVGVVAGFAAAGCWAYYMVHVERLGRRLAGPGFLAISIAVGACALAVVAPVWAVPWGLLDDQVAVSGRPAPVLLVLAGVVVLGTLAPFMLFLQGLRRIGAGPTSMLSTLEPVAAAGGAWLLLDQRLTALQLVGGLMVVLAAAAAQRPTAGPASAAGGQEGVELGRRVG
ncbi:MAG: Permease of the drug/metabolite transporter (DMT) superfamily [uncultured Thermoleophilia bacterium]|uniref:Permease of the drug/metabolite transporter (DMT) superfamily n=1 Tax=uncultured Thermoleophilia bacterium TaxID=1497501 RepID=A0A6J4TXY9_9ACTN|nr:MAG: Permease of the drug/metabolite transporter (DMT) superfamily [uncultured Thermoleophilia bacterium]